jgi:hypothetical protein
MAVGAGTTAGMAAGIMAGGTGTSSTRKGASAPFL